MNASLLVLVFAAVVIVSFEVESKNSFDADWSTVKRRNVVLPLALNVPHQANFNQRIAGGKEAVPNSIPYQAGLFISTSNGTFFCGGSLISTTDILTAASCLEGASQIQVCLGAHIIPDNEPTQQGMFTTHFILHAGWNSSTLQNNIAVVRLQQPATLNEYVQLAKLPRWSDVPKEIVWTEGKISGWGLDSAMSKVLRVVDAEIITNLVCKIRFGSYVQSTNICTSGLGGKGACNGDYGGPLVVNGTLVGIASYSDIRACDVGWPTVYTRITPYLHWIEAKTDVNIYP